MTKLPSVRVAVSTSLPFLLALAAACSSTESGAPGSSSSSSGAGGSSSPVGESTCLERCESKVTGCQAPADLVSQACGDLCGSSPTLDELECLEAKSCRELESDGGKSCQGAGTGSSSGSSGSPSSGSGGPQARVPLGGTCDCGGAQTCSDSQRGPCQGGLTCLDYFTSQNDDPDFRGYCTQACTGTGANDSCPSGFTCTSTLWGEVDTGDWCVQN